MKAIQPSRFQSGNESLKDVTMTGWKGQHLNRFLFPVAKQCDVNAAGMTGINPEAHPVTQDFSAQ